MYLNRHVFYYQDLPPGAVPPTSMPGLAAGLTPPTSMASGSNSASAAEMMRERERVQKQLGEFPDLL